MPTSHSCRSRGAGGANGVWSGSMAANEINPCTFSPIMTGGHGSQEQRTGTTTSIRNGLAVPEVAYSMNQVLMDSPKVISALSCDVQWHTAQGSDDTSPRRPLRQRLQPQCPLPCLPHRLPRSTPTPAPAATSICEQGAVNEVMANRLSGAAQESSIKKCVKARIHSARAESHCETKAVEQERQALRRCCEASFIM